LDLTLKKSFSFVSPFSLEQCDEALQQFHSYRHQIKLLDSSITDNGIRQYQLARHVTTGRNKIGYAQAELRLLPLKDGTVDVNGFAKIFILQILFYTYFIVATLTFAYVFRGFLPLALFLLLFTFFSARWLRMTFINRELLIQEIQHTLGME
jgi:hypothetical protein